MRDSEAIQQTVTELTSWWSERVEYKVIVSGETETRIKSVRQAALLDQLQRVSLDGVAPGDKCERSAPNKPASRPPGSMRGLELIDQIGEDARYCYNLLLSHMGREELLHRMSVVNVLRNIVAALPSVEHTQPSMLREIRGFTDRWRNDARLLLGYERPTKMLADTVCGECGGALAVAGDASTAVRCTGTPTAQPCGRTYPHSEWLALLAKHTGGMT